MGKQTMPGSASFHLSFDNPEPFKFIVFPSPEDLGLQAEINKDGESVTLTIKGIISIYLDAEGDYVQAVWPYPGDPQIVRGVSLEGMQVKGRFLEDGTVWYNPLWLGRNWSLTSLTCQCRHDLVTWWLKLDFDSCRCQFETMSTHTNSPDHTPIQPLHNPSLAAQVVVSQALIDNGEIASLAKKGWVLLGTRVATMLMVVQATLHLTLLQTTF